MRYLTFPILGVCGILATACATLEKPNATQKVGSYEELALDPDRLQTVLAAARKDFTPEEAEVFPHGNRIVIRTKVATPTILAKAKQFALSNRMQASQIEWPNHRVDVILVPAAPTELLGTETARRPSGSLVGKRINGRIKLFDDPK
jgi:hypothetical protein